MMYLSYFQLVSSAYFNLKILLSTSRYPGKIVFINSFTKYFQNHIYFPNKFVTNYISFFFSMAEGGNLPGTTGHCEADNSGKQMDRNADGFGSLTDLAK